jgi:tripartite-type tricarboxylate transporter receptor subunit TctC
MKLFKALAALVSVFPLMAAIPAAFAQPVTFPSNVRLVVPFAAGAGTDVLARAVAAQLGPRLGANVIVDNRVGASGLIGSGAVAKGPRDGSMLLFTSSSLTTTAATAKIISFDMNADLVPVAIVADGPMLVAVSSKSGIKTPAELVAAARAKPGGMTSSSGGIGTVGHMAAELLNDSAKIQMLHIPYKGAAPALMDLAAGTVDLLIASYSTLASQIKSGRVIPIAVTSLQASAAYPGMPTMASAAPGYNTGIWYGMFAPAGLPAPMLQRLNREVNEIANTLEIRAITQGDGALPLAMTPEELSRRVHDDYAIWKRLAAEKNIVTE